MSIARILKGLVAVSFALTSVAAAATTAQVNLAGSVASTLTITSGATAGATSLDLSSGQKIVQVADLTMSTNNDQGISLTVSSGSLTKTGGASIAFQVTTVADGGIAPLALAFDVASGTDKTASMSSAAGSVSKDLYVMYSPGATQDPGSYTGTINLTVSDN